MERKINYYLKSLDEIDSIKEEYKDRKPTLLLHSCCGPCACFPLTFLCPIFDVTILYNNSNIYPLEEYDRRLNELKKVLEFIKRDYGYEINLIEVKYNHDEYMKDLEPFKDQKEGSSRCVLCYTKRMKEAYDYAEANNFDFFTTVMTISRQKNSQILNKIGKSLEEAHSKTRYFYSDFKKNKGIDIGQEMAKEYSLYRQLYCGCEYSKIQSETKNNNVAMKKDI